MRRQLGMWTCLLAAPAVAFAAEPSGDLEQARAAAVRSTALLEAGRYEEANAVLQQGVKIAARLPPDNVWAGLLWHYLGSYYQDRRECGPGKAAYHHALRIWERSGHPMLVQTAVNLGSLQLDCGDTAAAEHIWRNVLEARVAALGETDLRRACAFGFRAAILMARKKYAEAEPLVESALQIWQRQLGPDEGRSVSMRNTLALLHARMHRYDEAERDQLRAIAVMEHVYGAKHPLMAKLYANLSAIYDAAGRPAEAEENCRKALDAATAGFGPDSAVTADILFAHAGLLRKLHRNREAAEAQRAARAIRMNSWREADRTVDVRDLGR